MDLHLPETVQPPEPGEDLLLLRVLPERGTAVAREEDRVDQEVLLQGLFEGVVHVGAADESVIPGDAVDEGAPLYSFD